MNCWSRCVVLAVDGVKTTWTDSIAASVFGKSLDPALLTVFTFIPTILTYERPLHGKDPCPKGTQPLQYVLSIGFWRDRKQKEAAHE